jgi:muramoyltetrapeptide carboxypeptidase LdcA involved in peptidoglycan recycling
VLCENYLKGPNLLPKKLSPGDEIRVIAPATSFRIIASTVREIALNNISAFQLQVSYGKNCEECDNFNSSSVASRIADLHDAFADSQVKGMFSAIGGFTSNQLLRYIDYDLIRANPKVFCGFSDITALGTAIHAKTGLVTYSGPHFSAFGMEKGLEYTLEYFQKCLMHTEPFAVEPSSDWSDDSWYQDQHNRNFTPNEGFQVVNEGEAEGILLGGNLCTLNLLQGTEYMPSLAESILLLEDDEESKPRTFDRDLQSLIHQPGFEGVKGIVIGRFQRESQMAPEELVEIIKTKPELTNIPAIVNADFGHTTPQFTFPIGGRGTLVARDTEVSFTIIEH